MTDQIISIAMIEAKARSAFARGVERDEHGFNPGAPAIEAWQAAWDAENAKLTHMVGRQAHHVSPLKHLSKLSSGLSEWQGPAVRQGTLP